MASTTLLVFVIYLISIWNILHAEDESTVKQNGRILYKYVDRGGMEWEYGRLKEKVPGKAKSEDVIVFNGPWTPNVRSSANSWTGSNLLRSVLVRFSQFN